MTPDDLADRLMSAAVRAGAVVDALPDTKLGRHIAGQLVRCGTSFGPNYEEGRAAESRRDFIHKLRVSLKELRETSWWLRYIVRCQLLPAERLNDLIQECEELIRILAKSIATAEENADPKEILRPRKKSNGH